jgi:hypothetical protein
MTLDSSGSPPMDAYAAATAIGGLCKSELRWLVRTRLNRVLASSDLAFSRFVAALAASIVSATSPEFEPSLDAILGRALPYESPDGIRRIRQKHVSVMMQLMALKSALPYVSDRCFHDWFEVEVLDGALARAGRPLGALFIGTHFYAHLLGAAVLDTAFQRNVRLWTSFYVKEGPGLAVFERDFLGRFKTDFHLSRNTSAGKLGILGELKEWAMHPERSVFIFSDFRLRSSPHDVRIQIGRDVYRMSGALAFVLGVWPEEKPIYSLRMLWQRRRFVIECRRMTTEEVSEYYTRLLPQWILERPAEWMNWFAAANMTKD